MQYVLPQPSHFCHGDLFGEKRLVLIGLFPVLNKFSFCCCPNKSLPSLKTTCHPAFADKLPTFWAVKSDIQVSGELTTSRGPGTALRFAISLVHQLFDESVAKEIGDLLVSVIMMRHFFLVFVASHLSITVLFAFLRHS